MTLPVIVTVIEAGPLEKQVCLLVESLRLWGGRFASATVVAVRPRRGPELSSSTRRELDRLAAEYCTIRRNDGFEWFAYLNKTEAVRYVADRRQGLIVWLDADILVLDEPSELSLPIDRPGFAACASNKNIGTASDDDEFAPYFRAACSALGVDYNSLPYVETEEEHDLIRAYWNSGVYAFTADTGLAELHHRFTASLVAKGIASHESKLFFSDQISLGLAAHHLNLEHRKLPLTHNFSLQPATIFSRLNNSGSNIRLLHYHGCLWPPIFEDFCSGLKPSYPEVASWLLSKGPLANDMPLYLRAYRKLAELNRQRQHEIALTKAKYY